jgi:hypothetical protein
MIFVTTFTKGIYQLCGRRLLTSFIETGNHRNHQLYVLFEDEDDLYTEHYPQWLLEWADKPFFTFGNLMTYEHEGYRVVDYVDRLLAGKIAFDHLYNSARSVKWFRPVAAIKYASDIIPNGRFSSIDADCLFTSEVADEFFDNLLGDKNIAFLGRENFKVMRHGNYDSNGNYIHTNTVPATGADTHTETGYIGFNLDKPGTRNFITKNMEYWTTGQVLELPYRTDCHTFDATRKLMKDLSYNNLCDPMGELSPIGSRVIEDSVLGGFLVHHKGTIGPNLYAQGHI